MIGNNKPLNIKDTQNTSIKRKSPGIVANMLHCDIIVNEFKLQLCYYILFQRNILGKGMNPLIPPSYGLNSTTTVLL